MNISKVNKAKLNKQHLWHKNTLVFINESKNRDYDEALTVEGNLSYFLRI